MDYSYYESRLGTDTEGRYDVTTLFERPGVFENLARDLLRPVDLEECTHVVGVGALGFVLGGYVAASSGLGFVPVRKGGKLPYPDDRLLRREVSDYSGEEKALELDPERLGYGTRVLLVDDWVETGGQMRAAADLVEASGAAVEAVSVLFAHRSGETAPLFEAYEVHAVGTDE